MIVAALIHAGADVEHVKAMLGALRMDGYRLSIEPVKKQGFAATRFVVDLDAQRPQPHRHLHHVVKILREATLPERVRDRSIRAFERLAEAEAKVHGSTIEKVHFHEVGAVDAILDVVGAMTAAELLKIDRFVCSPIPVGSGTITCSHGIMPVPAPATAELLRGVPLADTDETSELTTPTAAAVLTTLSESFGPLPAMTLSAIGYGAGMREGKTRPNVLRVILGASSDDSNCDEITVLETNLDDLSPQVIGHCMERLLAEGAWDVYAVPIHMKKWRSGVILTVLCAPDRTEAMERVVFAETTTFGIRRHAARRSRLARRHETVSTPFGPIRMKIGQRESVETASPEFEDCKTAAQRHHVPLRSVLAAAQIAWEGSRPKRRT